MVGNECVALLAHVLLAIGNQTLLAVRVKTRLIPRTRGLVDPAHPLLDSFLHIPPKGKPHFSAELGQDKERGDYTS
jgi:hypothetical protein